MSLFRNLVYYFKYISFICFLYGIIVLYPGLLSLKMGICCLVCVIIYSIVSFVMFFAKFNGEQYGLLNNIVVCVLHGYFCFIAYKYSLVGSISIGINDFYFSLNFFVGCLCLVVLTVNKFIVSDD